MVSFSGPKVAAAYATNDYDDEPVPGKFDEAKQTWEPTDPQTTIEQTITIRVDRAAEQGVESLITGAEEGSGCINSHFSGFSVDRIDSWRLTADWCSGSCTEHEGPTCTPPNGTYVDPEVGYP